MGERERERFEQVRILPTISQIPALVPGDAASHGQVQLCRKACLRPLGPGATPPEDEMVCYQGALIFQYRNPLVQAQDFTSNTF